MTVVNRDRAACARAIRSLDNGSRMTRIEFERRYEASPHVKKAELIEGVVYMASPVSAAHSRGQNRITLWLATYFAFTPGTDSGTEGTVRLDNDNVPQPDAHLRIRSDHGGQTRTPDRYIEGAPELVAEVALSSASIDLHGKLRAYRRNGVREYVVWRVEDEALDWFVLRDGEFVPLEMDQAGLLKSETFPGLNLDPVALLRDDMPRVLGVLQAGLASPEHAAFVAALASRKQLPSP